MALPGETEAGSAGEHPAKGYPGVAHRNDEFLLAGRGADFSHRPPNVSRSEDYWGRFRGEAAKFLTRLGLMDSNNEPKPRGIPENEVSIARALKNVGYKTCMVGIWHVAELPIYSE